MSRDLLMTLTSSSENSLTDYSYWGVTSRLNLVNTALVDMGYPFKKKKTWHCTDDVISVSNQSQVSKLWANSWPGSGIIVSWILKYELSTFCTQIYKKSYTHSFSPPFCWLLKIKNADFKNAQKKQFWKEGRNDNWGTCEAYLTSFREESIHIDELFLMNYSYI